MKRAAAGGRGWGVGPRLAQNRGWTVSSLLGGAPWGPAPQAVSQAAWVMGLPGRTPPALLAPGAGCVTGTGAGGPLPGDPRPCPRTPAPSVRHPVLPLLHSLLRGCVRPWLSLES